MTTETKHSSEPWSVKQDILGSYYCIIGNELRMVGECFEDGETQNAFDAANARRIVACVNLMKGYSTDDIEAGKLKVSL